MIAAGGSSMVFDQTATDGHADIVEPPDCMSNFAAVTEV